MQLRRHGLLAAAALLLLSGPANADPRAECEEWARADNVSAMLWDRYVDRCIASLQGEEVAPSGTEDKEPAAATPEPPEADTDRAY